MLIPPMIPFVMRPFFTVIPIPLMLPVPLSAPIIGVIPVANPNSVRMNRFMTLFTNDDAASSSTLCHPIMMLSANARIMTQACPSMIGRPILSISLIFFMRRLSPC